MILYETPQTKNRCYINGKPATQVGILVHSTGANNPYLKRYVDAPEYLGVHTNGNHWNNTKANKCMHGFIGKDKDGQIAVAHTLPYNVACWGSGRGSKGSYNYDPTAHIQFEVCEDGLTDETYYRQAMGCAEDYCVYLCNLLGLKSSSICGHYEASDRGYASNHCDPRHWMRRFGDSMDSFRARVAQRIGEKIEVAHMGLKRGDSGEAVRELQERLILLGIDLGRWGADGKFGAVTEDAVKAFQQDHALDVTGVWSVQDQAKLDELQTAVDDFPPEEIDNAALLDELTGIADRLKVIATALRG